MRVSVDSAIFERHPDLLIGVAFLSGVKNDAANAAIEKLLANEATRVANLLFDKQVSSEPYVASWRSAYKQFGAKASKYLSSLESLLRRAVKYKVLPSINPLTDLYNYISIKYRIPAGGDDASKIVGAIQLKMADEQLPQVVLIGKEFPEKSEVGEVVYTDAEGIICRRCNYRQAERTMIDGSTTNGIFYFEGLAPVGKEIIDQVLDEFCMLAKSHLDGDCTYAIISKDIKTIEL